MTVTVNRFVVQRFKGWRERNTGRLEDMGAVENGIFPGSMLFGTMV